VGLHRRLSYVPGDVNLWPNLSGGEAIDLLGALRGGLDPRRREELIGRLRLDPTKRCRTYSKGNRQKVALVAAFACDVELFILDEPTAGLDPLMDSVFRDCVQQASDQGKTVLLSSHLLSEVEALCERISIIRDGAVVESGSLDEMRHLTHTHIEVETARPVPGLASLAGVHAVSIDGARAHFDVDTGHLPEVHRHLAQAGVRSLHATPPRLEDLFMRHYAAEEHGREVSL
jgi:ABC-2 type transport system ATP-binding protein